MTCDFFKFSISVTENGRGFEISPSAIIFLTLILLNSTKMIYFYIFVYALLAHPNLQAIMVPYVEGFIKMINNRIMSTVKIISDSTSSSSSSACKQHRILHIPNHDDNIVDGINVEHQNHDNENHDFSLFNDEHVNTDSKNKDDLSSLTYNSNLDDNDENYTKHLNEQDIIPDVDQEID